MARRGEKRQVIKTEMKQKQPGEEKKRKTEKKKGSFAAAARGSAGRASQKHTGAIRSPVGICAPVCVSCVSRSSVSLKFKTAATFSPSHCHCPPPLLL